MFLTPVQGTNPFQSLKMEKITQIQELQVNYKRRYGDYTIHCSADANKFARQVYELTSSNIDLKEYFFMLYLNRANKVIGYYPLSEGGISGTVADIRLAMSVGLKCLSSSMLMIHNHPSGGGNVKPSEQDKKLTQQFAEASKLLQIKLLDHIILTDESYYSFADSGLL